MIAPASFSHGSARDARSVKRNSRVSENGSARDAQAQDLEQRLGGKLNVREGVDPEEETTVANIRFLEYQQDGAGASRCHWEPISRRSVRSLRPVTWLNDGAMDGYLQLLQARDNKLCQMDPGRKGCLFFRAAMMDRLANMYSSPPLGYEYDNVKKYKRRTKGEYATMMVMC